MKSSMPERFLTVLCCLSRLTPTNTNPCFARGWSTRCARLGNGTPCSSLFFDFDGGGSQNQSDSICSQCIAKRSDLRLPVRIIAFRYLPSLPPISLATRHNAVMAWSPAAFLNQGRSRRLAPSHGRSMSVIGAEPIFLDPTNHLKN